MLSLRLRVLPLFFLLAFASTGCSGCNALPGNPNVPPSTRPSFGELVYRIVRQQLQNSADCPTQYVDALTAHHTDFVTTFDHVVEHGLQNDVPQLLGGTIKPYVDNDRLPQVVDAMAATLALLVSDTFDPNRDTIRAIVDLSQAQTLLESSMAIQLVAAVLEDPTITDKVHALAVIAQENDGVTYLMDDGLDLASYALAADPTPSTCTGLATPDVQATLLRTSGFVEDARLALGTAFYIARPDPNGNPAVKSYAGVIAAPFVDADHDGVADVNVDGEPVDANGRLVDLAMIGEASAAGRDGYGRAIDGRGQLVFDYYDVKRTALSYAVQIGANLFETGVHHQLPAVANAVLGAPVACTDGTANCRNYPTNNNLVADVAWLGFEAAEYTRLGVLLRTLTTLMEANPTQSEQLLVALGDVVRALDASNIQLTDTALTDAVTGLVPLLEQVFEQPSQNTIPTARVLIDVLQSLGTQVDALPSDILYMVEHQYDADVAGRIEAPNLSLARYPAGGDDNRTGLEQLIELFAHADCGYVGPGPALSVQNIVWTVIHALDGQVQPGTLAQIFVGLLANQSVGTVSTLIDLLLGVQSLPIIGSIVGGVIEGVGCNAPNQANTIQYHLNALKILKDSGGLDWILPLAKAFQDNGQLRLLVDIFHYLAADMWKDEDGNATTASAMRQLMPVIRTLVSPQTAGVATSTPANRVIDVARLMTSIPASDGNGNAADVLVETIAYVANTATIQTRTGNVGGTSILVELLKKVKTAQQRIAGQPAARTALTAMVDAITPLLTQTTGTGTNRRLANPNLRVLVSTFVGAAAGAVTLPAASYLCYVHDAQTESRDFLLSKHFATAVRVMNHLATSPNAAALESWLLSMMRGRPTDRAGEIYGRGLQLAAGALSTDAASGDMSQIASWMGAGLTATGPGGFRDIVATLDGLLQSDTRQTMLTMVRTLIDPGPLASRERPVSTFADTASDVASIDAANACMATGTHLSATMVESNVQGVVDFLQRNPNDGFSTGIEMVWALVGAVAPAE